LWSDVFGDPADLSQYQQQEVNSDGKKYTVYRWDPSRPSSRQWLDRLAATMQKTGTICQHVSNNAPQHLADPDEERRREGIRVAKVWMDASAVLGAKTMRANTGVYGTRIMPEAHETGYPKNDKIVLYLRKCIESFKELADYGEKVGVKITIENHWGLCVLEGDWSEDEDPSAGGKRVAIETGGTAWTVTLDPASVAVARGPGPRDASLSGGPSDVLLWLWGRAGDDRVRRSGDAAALALLRTRLALATQ
jgi:sugar phosphate isomerase/epimerase